MTDEKASKHERVMLRVRNMLSILDKKEALAFLDQLVELLQKLKTEVQASP